MSLSGK